MLFHITYHKPRTALNLKATKTEKSEGESASQHFFLSELTSHYPPVIISALSYTTTTAASLLL